MTESTLDADALVDAAIAETGLSDFGEGPWHDGLDVLVESLNADAGLNELGTITWQNMIGNLLRNRLRVEDTYRRHPEIDVEEVPAPIWIVGIPRTGTTALSSLLTQDPALRALRSWEATSPCPPPELATQHHDRRIEAAQDQVDMMLQIEPALDTMHEIEPEGPTENHDLHGMTFRTHAFHGLARVTSYQEWWERQDLTPAFEYQRRTAKLLQWRCPPNRWHFKSPPDLYALQVIRAVFPGARIVWTHREPAAAIASISSFEAHLWRMGSDGVAFTDVGPPVLEVWQEATRRAIRVRESFDDDAILDVSFREFRSDQMGVVERLYDWLGSDLTGGTRARMDRWLHDHPAGKHGKHRYTLEQFGLEERQVAEAMKHYTERFVDLL